MAVVAARQSMTPHPRRRTVVRGLRFAASTAVSWACPACLSALTAGMLAFAPAMLSPAPALAQSFTYNPLPPSPKPAQRPDDGQMLVQATEVDYDYNNQRVSAVGNVQIYHNGSTVQADRVIYDQKTKRLRAEGNVRMTDVDGKITYAEIMDLSDDYRDGFVDSLRLETADRTRMAATRADRTEGRYTVFQSGVYTACAECRDNPKKPPLWQVKGARIIHDQQEKMLYFEDARLEFFGVPMAYLPYFSTPDPTVKRKSGFLQPWATQSSATGFNVEVPYYWALAPDYDVTITPRVSTRQGVLLQGEFRQRLINGAYEIRAYGINQLEPSAFAGAAGDRTLRGAVQTSGQFALNDKWVWGWDGTLLSDKTFFQDYSLSVYRNPLQSFLTTPTEATSQVYLTGLGNRSYFDIRSIYYYGFSAADVQSQIPVVAPVIDYSNVVNRSILGGELSYKGNFTNLTRSTAAFDALTTTAVNNGWCLPTSADPAMKTQANCLLRGVPGTYTRLSGEVDWRRSFTDPIGQIWTPFVSLRGDVINASVDNQPGVSNFTNVGDTQVGRLMPAVGFEYRYPFINVQPWGTTTIEPIAQVIIRPNETHASSLPNEDSQSLTFDASNLFSVNKFAGWDRVEGGSRANVGVQATTQFDRGGSVNVLFGQSYQLFGLNSYAVQDLTNTGLDSGLDKRVSDYVGRVTYQPNRTYTFSASTRLDSDTLAIQRLELEGRASFDRWSISMIYGNYGPQPELGYQNRREGILTTGSIKLAANWVASGGARFDLHSNTINQYTIGAGYVDDCFVLAVNYITDYAYQTVTTANPTVDHRIMLQIGLRTIGSTSISQSVGSGATQ
ncbi:LPS-assembly protein LptD [Bradyrhizobium sp. WD16]|uniref:LPS-assembly protein LptD n=1 Tax=Bradyrhizobium sp. WD16 TaxID=1521768 RepID=UPI0035326ACA